MSAPTGLDIASLIDHTLLKPEATPSQIVQLCEEAKAYQFASVCINPTYVPLVTKQVAGSGVKVCTVIGFPLGATTTQSKVFETQDAITNGADEIDMVINVGALKAKEDAAVEKDVQAVRAASRGKILKVIVETSLLSEEEKVRACQIAKHAGADFVKTSTGFGPGGATVTDVRLMRKTVGPELGIKASGGIRDAETAQAMLDAGATRLGTSSGIAIVSQKPGSVGKKSKA
jgi:deoxyribose-phosphate aldolase